MHYLELALSLV